MAGNDWLRFWSPDSWRQWNRLRPEWKQYRSEERRFKNELSSHQSGLAEKRSALEEAEQGRRWAAEVGPREIPVKTARSETGLAVVSGVTLSEIRKREGKEVWTVVDRGTVYLTDRQAIFSGSKTVKFPYSKITRRELGGNGLLLSISSRKASHILGGPARKVSSLITSCMASAQGETPAAPFAGAIASASSSIAALEMEIADLESKRTALVKPPRPVSPAWLPASIVLVLAMFGSAVADDNTAPGAVASDTTTSTQQQTSSTSTAAKSTSSSSTSTTSSLPDVPHAEVLFAGLSAGPFGDPSDPMPGDAESGTVVSITDGDTLEVALSDGSVETVRLIGINSPERNECWADEAALALAAMTPPGSGVGLTSDVSNTDQFDRLLRYLWVGSYSINEEMVRRGAAISRRYPPDTAMAATFEAAQSEAKEAHLGLWAPDACGPEADAEVRIIDIEYDAPGNDNENLNEEWIRLRNSGDNLVDMTDWGIKDESATNRYAFPAGFVLAPGEAVTVFTGCGEDFGTELYWCSVGSAVWNNDGDTAFLLDPFGNTHDSQSYAPATTPTASTSSTTTSTTTTVAPTTTVAGSNCHSSYPDVCIPPPPPDLNCGDIPYKRFRVVGSDPHGFDGDNDGVGCES